MRFQVLALAAALTLAVGAAQAQQPSEVIGDYPANFTGTGPGCEGRTEPVTFNVKSITDGKISFGVNGSDFIEADLSTPSMRFHGTHAEGSQTVIFDGGFTRARDSISVEMTWNNAHCAMRLNGTKPAPLLAEAPVAAPAASPAAPAAPTILGTAPVAPATPAAAVPPAQNPLIFYGPLGLLLLAAGAGLGWLFARRKGKPDA